MSFVIYSRKTGKDLNQNFLQEVYQESCGWNSICQILILPPWLVTSLCFLVKISQILQKLTVFIPERGEEIKNLFWHNWIAQWLKFFRTTAFFFDFDRLQEETRSQSWTKSANFGSVSFPKILESFKNFPNSFFFPRILPLVRISAILDHIERVRAQKPPKNGYFVAAESVSN